MREQQRGDAMARENLKKASTAAGWQPAEYKAVKLNPKEIREKLETLRLYENEGLTPDKIKELKERDTPMKPEVIGRNSAVGCLIGTCPRCGGMLRSYMKFCDECGQRLWWEEK